MFSVIQRWRTEGEENAIDIYENSWGFSYLALLAILFLLGALLLHFRNPAVSLSLRDYLAFLIVYLVFAAARLVQRRRALIFTSETLVDRPALMPVRRYNICEISHIEVANVGARNWPSRRSRTVPGVKFLVGGVPVQVPIDFWWQREVLVLRLRDAVNAAKR